MATLAELLAQESSQGMTVADLMALEMQQQSTHPEQQPNPLPGQIDALRQGFRNGASLGLNDEMGGALAVPLGGYTDAEGNASLFNYSAPMDERYTSTRDRIRNEATQAQEAHPAAYTGGEIGGGVAMSSRAIPAIVGKGLLGTMGRGAAFGAGEGAVVGAGNADGQDIAGSAAKGGAVGSVVGAGAPLAGAALRAAADPVVGGIQAMRGRPYLDRAGRTMARTMDRAGKTPADLHMDILRAQGDGQGMFVTADALGNAGQRQLSGVARQPGAGRDEIERFLDTRQNDQHDRIGGFVSEALGAPDTAQSRRSAMITERSNEADTLYDAARANAQPVDVRGALGVIEGRLGPMRNSGVQGDGIDGVFGKYRDRLMAANPQGGALSVELSDFNRVLGVKQDLQDDIAAAVRAGRNNEARQLTNLQNALDEALEASSDGYRAANDSFRARSREIDAIDRGAEATRPGQRVDDIAPQFRGMTDAEKSGFRVGYADKRIGQMEASPRTSNAARTFNNTRDSSLMQEMASDPAQWDRRLAREETMFDTRRKALGGSQTADNLADQDDTQNVSALASLLMGRVGDAAGNVGRRGMSAATGMNEATRNLLAQALLSRDPQKALAPLLASAQKGAKADRNVEALMRHLGYQGAQGAGLLP